jgi:hypothetical protein
VGQEPPSEPKPSCPSHVSVSFSYRLEAGTRAPPPGGMHQSTCMAYLTVRGWCVCSAEADYDADTGEGYQGSAAERAQAAKYAQAQRLAEVRDRFP